MEQKEIKSLITTIEQHLEDGNYSVIKETLEDLHIGDIAEIVEYVSKEDRVAIFSVLDVDEASEVFEKVNEATRNTLFEELDEHIIVDIIRELPADDAVDVLSELPKEKARQYIRKLIRIEPALTAKIRYLMRYEEDTAGGIMDPVFVAVKADATILEAIEEIRSQEIDEDFFAVYVVDNDGKYLGDVRIRKLFTAPPQTKIKDLIEEDRIYVTVTDDQEHVSNTFSRYDLITVPVVDQENRLVGRITADIILEVAKEEADEDIYAMAGTDPDELENTSVFNAARIRMTWLAPCLLGTAVTATVIFAFKDKLFVGNFSYVFGIAMAFVPMIAAISGNAGLQTSAIIVCGLASGHIAAERLKQVFLREFRIALLVALACGIIGGIICWGLPRIVTFDNAEQAVEISALDIRVTLAFSVAMFSAIIVSTTLGLLLPFSFRKIGIDPAISSGPLVTTANDSISVAIYLSLTLLLVSL
ncbi:Magnesium transporter MgtE [Limihaloglobus sulfuriphilus]|uniref:Magnesium transporter MgtE n=1 Tax=Limihaloglobus sulfuriphilus TaxID=1851148 RepID=A0A1Q2MAX3_9BACT|nr:magnesium transporter [Limihaloglobus sulfuriphilus]AQQ69831.1 Magnesium transporter MgtE [Limihaloglobus sulfuriphilus]